MGEQQHAHQSPNENFCLKHFICSHVTLQHTAPAPGKVLITIGGDRRSVCDGCSCLTLFDKHEPGRTAVGMCHPGSLKSILDLVAHGGAVARSLWLPRPYDAGE